MLLVARRKLPRRLDFGFPWGSPVMGGIHSVLAVFNWKHVETSLDFGVP